MPSIYTVRESLKLIAEIGLANIASQISHLTQAFVQGVRSLGIASKTADDNTTGPLVVLRSADAATVATNLAAQGVLVSARRDGVRFSFHVYNNLTDVETALSALKSNLHLMVRR